MPSSDTQFQGKGAGTKHGETPIPVRFSSEVRALLKAMPNTQAFIRQSVNEKLGRSDATPTPAPMPNCDDRVEEAIASVLPTIPIKSRVAIAKAFKKLTAKLED